jgi:hypothetical protein
MDFSFIQHDLNLTRLLGLIVLVILEVLGFKAVTSPGKIYHFVEEFFKKQVDKREYCKPEGNKHFDDLLLQNLPLEFKKYWNWEFDTDTSQFKKIINDTMMQEGYFSDDPVEKILANLVNDVQNKYWFFKKVNKYPDWVVDPTVGCPTCMPSVHTLITYTLICFVQGWHWNPFIWVGVALAATFFTEQLWKTRNILDKINKKLDK